MTRVAGSSPDPNGAVARRIALAAVLLAAAVVAVYHAAPDNTWHMDDISNITSNPATRMETLTAENLRRATVESPLSRRPIPYLTFALDWWRGGGEARTFLRTNVALHAATTIAVFGLFLTILRTGGGTGRPSWDIAAAGLAAGLWGAHPIQVQAVTYIVQRMAQLACLFTVLAVMFYLLARGASRTGARWALFAAAAIAAVCAICSKENAWVVPVLLYLAELGIVRNRRALFQSGGERVLASAAVAAGVSAFVAILAGIGPLADRLLGAYRIRDFSMIERVLTQPRVILFHLSQVVWPWPGRFSLDHDFTVSTSLLDPPVTLAAILVAAAWCAAGVLLLSRRGRRVLGFLILWFPITLAVESSVVGLEMVFEHRMYLPTVGLFGLVALLLNHVLERSQSRQSWILSVTAIVVVMLALSTATYVPKWRTQQSLAENSARHAPNSARPWGMLGKEYLVAGSIDQAEEALTKALRIDPSNRWALEWMGVALFERGRIGEAEQHLRAALELDPYHPDIHNHLGELEFHRQRFHAAERYFQYAVGLRPWEPSYSWNLAIALEKQKSCREALAEWRRFLELQPGDEDQRRVENHIRETFLDDTGSCAVVGGTTESSSPESG